MVEVGGGGAAKQGAEEHELQGGIDGAARQPGTPGVEADGVVDVEEAAEVAGDGSRDL